MSLTKLNNLTAKNSGSPSDYLIVHANLFNPVVDVVNGLQDGTQSASVNDLTVADDADVVGDLTAGTITSDAGVSGTTGSFSGGISQGTANVSEFTVLTTLTATEIVGTAAGDIGHASGATLVAAPTSAYTLEFVSAVAIYDFGVAAYTSGANDLVVAIGSGGAAISGVCSTANLLGAAGDKIVYFVPLSTAAVPMSVGTAISLRGTAFTQPGTAAGVLRVYTTYRKILTGL